MSGAVAHDFDTVIAGAGPVGCALALWLLKRGHDPKRLWLIDKNSTDASLHDPRVLALSAGSLMLLQELAPEHEWRGVDLQQVHVSQQAGLGHVSLSAPDMKLPRLGRVVRYGDLMQTLLSALEARAVNIARSETLTHWQEHSAGVQIQTRQRSCVTGVLIQAEGGLAQDHADELTLYQQTALVTEVSAARPQAQTAFERFTRDGPLALLPVAHSAPGAYAVVWCMRPAQAERRMKLKADELALELQQAMGQRLGALTLLGPSQSYPLGLKRQSASGVRHMRIGNAAQILHPVAGQGLNLGLRDAYCLAQIWNEAHGWPLPLRHHARQRQPDRLILTVLTDVLARAFTWPVLPVAGAGLMALDLCPPARRALAHTLIFGWR